MTVPGHGEGMLEPSGQTASVHVPVGKEVGGVPFTAAHVLHAAILKVQSAGAEKQLKKKENAINNFFFFKRKKIMLRC